MLDRPSVLDLLYSKRVSPIEFNWDRLWAPSIYNFMSEFHLEKLYNIATSIRYAGDSDKKDDAIRNIMYPLGFRRFAAGTNRIVYTYLEDTSFLVKIAIDKVGLQNSPDEFRNQMILKPFVCKCFETHPTGIIGSFERGLPITNLHEFLSIWDDVFDAILHMTGKYVVEDIGTNFFMNWCIRKNFGPVLCDYPEVFELDGNKLFCNRPIYPGTKFPVCGGPIDHDSGFNCLVCTKCGKQYRARELSAAIKRHDIIMKGEYDMDVMIVRGDEILVDGRDIVGTDTIQRPTPAKIKAKRSREIKASIVRGDTVIAGDNMITKPKAPAIDWTMQQEPVIIPNPPQPECVTKFNNSIAEGQKPNPVEEYLKDKPDLRKEIEGIFGYVPNEDQLNMMTNVLASNLMYNPTIPTADEKEEKPKADPQEAAEQLKPIITELCSQQKYQLKPEEEIGKPKEVNVEFKAQVYTNQDLDETVKKVFGDIKDLKETDLKDSATEAEESDHAEDFDTGLYVEGVDKKQAAENLRSCLDDLGDEDDSEEGNTSEQEEIGIIPPDQIETPAWNIVDPNAPEPKEPNYNSIYYSPDNPEGKPNGEQEQEPVKEEPKEEVKEEQAEERPAEEEKQPEKSVTTNKEYGDKESVGSSVMADALKGFRMDTPVQNTAPPQFRKRPEVPKGLEDF